MWFGGNGNEGLGRCCAHIKQPHKLAPARAPNSLILLVPSTVHAVIFAFPLGSRLANQLGAISGQNPGH